MSKGKKKIFKRVVLPIIIVAVALGAYFYFRGGNKPVYDSVLVKRGNLVQEVSVTGNVKPAQDVSLAFESSGKVAEIYVKVGDQAKSGDILVALDKSEISAKLAQAKASLATEQANLDQDIKGTRQEEIDIKQAELSKAKQDLENYYASVLNILYDSYNKADDAVRTKMDELFTNDEIAPILTFSTENQAKLSSESQRKSLTGILDLWLADLNKITSTSSNDVLDQGMNEAQTNLSSARNLLDTLMDAINNSTSLSQADINAYKANINTARTNISTAITNINAQEQYISSQKVAIQTIQNELNLELAGSTPEEIAAQKAKVDAASANVLDYEAQLKKATLYSPIDGVVTKQDAKIGQIAVANTPLVSVISKSQFQIETNVPEADIAKIKIGNLANVTLDAYGNDVVFNTKVIKIDPAETVIDGVSTYKTTLQFDNEDNRILSGMTANIDVITAEKDNVLVLPYRAVNAVDSEKFVSIAGLDGIISQRKVETGIRGTDGNIEIISGLNEGEKVVISN